MKRLLWLLLCTLPGWSEVTVQGIQVIAPGSDARQPVVAVRLHNGGSHSVRVDRVSLELRGGHTWNTVQVWTDPVQVAAGEQTILMVAPGADTELGKALLQPGYELQAAVELSAPPAAAEGE